MKRLFTIILSLVLVHVFACAQESRYWHSDMYPFIVISDDSVKEPPVFTDDEFCKNAESIIFEVNKIDVKPNDPFLNLYDSIIAPAINTDHMQLRKVYVRGAASPEGPYDNNKRLGEGRRDALIDILKRNLKHQYIDLKMSKEAINEDYGFLCIKMKQNHDPEYRLVKELVDGCRDENGVIDEPCCKEKLMKYNGGKLWERLKQEYYPGLRAARLIIWLTRPDKEHEPDKAPEGIFANPNKKGAPDTSGRKVLNPPVSRPDTVYIQVPAPEPVDTDTIPHHPIFALKTNLLYDALTFVNGEIEIPIGNHWSFLGEVIWPWWLGKQHNDWCAEMGCVGFEMRYYFRKWKRHNTFKKWRSQNNMPLHGWFIGAYGNSGYYDFQAYRRKGIQGEFYSGGITLGYESYIGRHWRMDVSVAAGVLPTHYRRYHVNDNKDQLDLSNPEYVLDGFDQHLWRDTPKGHDLEKLWIGPTKIKISLSYLITRKCKKNRKKAVGDYLQVLPAVAPLVGDSVATDSLVTDSLVTESPVTEPAVADDDKPYVPKGSSNRSSRPDTPSVPVAPAPSDKPALPLNNPLSAAKLQKGGEL